MGKGGMNEVELGGENGMDWIGLVIYIYLHLHDKWKSDWQMSN